MSTPGFQVTIGGLTVVMAYLTSTEFINGLKLAPKNEVKLGDGFKLINTFLRMSIRKVNDVDVDFAKLSGLGLAKYIPRTRHLVRLGQIWSEQTVGTETEREAVKKSVKVSTDGDKEVWTFCLPGGREIVMEEQPVETVAEALNKADISDYTSVRAFTSIIEKLRHSIASIDGEPIGDLEGAAWDNVFSVKETYLAGYIWTLMHEGEDNEPGEVCAVSGI